MTFELLHVSLMFFCYSIFNQNKLTFPDSLRALSQVGGGGEWFFSGSWVLQHRCRLSHKNDPCWCHKGGFPQLASSGNKQRERERERDKNNVFFVVSGTVRDNQFEHAHHCPSQLLEISIRGVSNAPVANPRNWGEFWDSSLFHAQTSDCSPRVVGNQSCMEAPVLQAHLTGSWVTHWGPKGSQKPPKDKLGSDVSTSSTCIT